MPSFWRRIYLGSKKKKALFLLLCVCAISIFYAKDFLSFALENGLKMYVKTHYQARLHCQGLSFSSSGILIRKPSLSPLGENPFSNWHLDVDQIEVRWDFSPKNLSFYFDIHSLSPRLYLAKKQDNFMLPWQWSVSELDNVDIYWHVEKGSIVLHDLSSKKEEKHVIDFCYESALQESSKAMALFSFPKQTSKKSKQTVTLSIDFQKEKEFLELYTKKLSCEKFLCLSRFFGHNPLPSWQAKEGLWAGNLLFSRKNARIYLEKGSLKLSGAVFENPFLDMEFSSPLLTLNVLHKQKEESQKTFVNSPDYPQITAFDGNTFWEGITGSFLIEDVGQLTFRQKNLAPWVFKQLKGGVHFIWGHHCSFAFEGISSLGYKNLEFRSLGNIQLSESIEPMMDLRFSFPKLDQRDVMARLLVDDREDQEKKITASFSHLTKDELFVIQNLLHLSFPKLHFLHLKEGDLSGKASLKMNGSKIQSIYVDDIAGYNLKWNWGKLHGQAKALEGFLSFDPRQKQAIESLNAKLFLKQASFELATNSHETRKIDHLQGSLAIHRGNISQAHIDWDLQGIKGKFSWNQEDNNPLRVVFKGKVDALNKRLIHKYLDTRRFSRDFNEASFFLSCHGDWRENQFALEGDCLIEKDKQALGPSVLFGVDICDPKHLFNAAYTAFFSPSIYDELKKDTLDFVSDMPLFAQCSLPFMDSMLQEEEDWLHFFKGAWFSFEEMDLSHFLSPMIFTESQLRIRGTGGAKGILKGDDLCIDYHAKDIAIEDEDLLIEAKKIGTDPQDTSKNFLRAKHYIYLPTHESFGSFPVQNACYFDKNFSLKFDEIQTDLEIGHRRLYLKNAHCKSDEVEFWGELDLDFSQKKSLFLNTSIKKMYGKIAQARRFLSRVSQASFVQFPLEGMFQIHPQSQISLAFSPEKFQYDVCFRGSVQGGKIHDTLRNLSFEDLDIHFDFDTKRDSLHIPHIRGILQTDQGGTFPFQSHYVRLFDFSHMQSEFDISFDGLLGQKGRLAGKMTTHIEGSEPVQHIKLDADKTYLGGVFPNIESLLISNWKDIEKLNSSPNISLEHFSKDMENLSKLGLVLFPSNMIRALKHYPLKGKLLGAVCKESKDSDYIFNFQGRNLNLYSKAFAACLLKGRGKDRHYHVEALHLDAFKASLELKQDLDQCLVNNLQIFYDKAFTVSVKTANFSSGGLLSADVGKLYVDFDHLLQVPYFPKKMQAWLPKGTLQANGNFSLDLSQGQSFAAFYSQWETSFQNLEFHGHHLENKKRFYLSYTPKEGVVLEDLQLFIQKRHISSRPVECNIGKVTYHKNNNHLKLSPFSVEIPYEYLPILSDFLGHYFSLGKTSIYPTLFKGILKEGSLVFKGECRLNEDDISLGLQLKDEKYLLFDYPLDLQDVDLKIDRELSLRGKWRYQGQILAFALISQREGPPKGTLNIWKDHLEPSKENQISIDWSFYQEHLDIERIYGKLYGISSDFHMDKRLTDDKEIVLQGKGEVDFQHLFSHFPFLLQKKFQWLKIGQGYFYEGELLIPREDYSKQVFRGVFKGNHFDILGAKLQTLFSKVELALGKAQIYDLFIQDEIGHCYVDNITVAKNSENDRWELMLALLRLENFQPSLFQTDLNSQKIPKSLVVNVCELRELKGYLSEPESFLASGVLEFKNIPKKYLFTPLLLIPGEIISRIGLDPQLLSPATGTIVFEFREGYIHIVELRDVYSEKRRSRFLLVDENPSYLNYQGDLNLRVKVKQHSLILKPLELTTITIKGHLAQPKYTIQKQKDKEIVELETEASL